jgi:hypothetical protein
MSLADVPPLRGKQLAALRGVAATPGGLRITAYPSAMPLLVQMGLVEERPTPRGRHGEGRARFLTPEGRQTVKAHGTDEV